MGAGLQNGTARKLAVPDLTTTVLTQTIAGAAFESRLGGGSDSRIGRRGLAAVAMFLGALIGALTELKVSQPLGLLLAAVLLVDRGGGRRPTVPWTTGLGRADLSTRGASLRRTGRDPGISPAR